MIYIKTISEEKFENGQKTGRGEFEIVEMLNFSTIATCYNINEANSIVKACSEYWKNNYKIEDICRTMCKKNSVPIDKRPRRIEIKEIKVCSQCGYSENSHSKFPCSGSDIMLLTQYLEYTNHSGNRFENEVRKELNKARSKHNAFDSLHKAYAVMLEKLEEFWYEVRKKRSDRPDIKNFDKETSTKEQMAHELIQLAAMCQRTTEDLNLLDGEK